MSSFCAKEFLQSGAVIGSTPGRLLVGWGQGRFLSRELVHPERPAWYLPGFFLDAPAPWIEYPHWSDLSTAELERALPSFPSSGTCDWNLQHPERFRQTFEELQSHFQRERLRKAVPYLFAVSPHQMTPERLTVCLRTALSPVGRKAGHVYGCWNAESGVLGLTPERLFSHSQDVPQKVETMALAGTSHPSRSQEDFFQNEKERYEQGLVVEGICRSLRELGTIRVGLVQLHPLPKLTHLMTPIELTLNHPFQFEDLVRALHPTPAVGALPLHEGRKWLQEHEVQTPRGHYGAPFGVSNLKNGLSLCLVGIRNVQWDAAGMRIGAGCGIVKQSQFEKEWQEILLKIRAIRDQLHL